MDMFIIRKVCIFYILVICELSISKRMGLPDLNKLGGSKLNECQRCKVLTDSFNHWFDKTSRGKYEGGDAAWEEAKLKSYARSEMRLVEIQEGLCSELKKHQDQCYKLAEEAEQALEKWWFHVDSNSDLHTWLCIENLHYCCPQKHYGEDCLPCSLDKSNKICGGNGKCDGEGTRTGNGSCICHKGFTGYNCEECSSNYYKIDNFCVPCHKSCEQCSGEGAAACVACRAGWKLEGNECVDVNECASNFQCGPSQFCVNTDGSYKCKACDKSCLSCSGPGSSSCTSCEPDSVLWSGVCVDEPQKKDLLQNGFKRLALYTGLLIMLFFICRTSKSLASVVIVAIASYIYFSEKTSKMNVLDTLAHYL